jgi:excisionase family DNA binding protein
VSKLAYTVAEAASLLSMSRSRLYELIQSGAIESVKFGRSRRITQEQMHRFLQDHAVESLRAPPHERRL